MVEKTEIYVTISHQRNCTECTKVLPVYVGNVNNMDHFIMFGGNVKKQDLGVTSLAGAVLIANLLPGAMQGTGCHL